MSLAARASRARRIPWVIKYRPKRVEEVVDQEKAKSVLVPWIREWAEGRIPSKRAALLYGPPGVGKTSLVEALANEYKFELLELNASDYRRAQDIRRAVGAAATKRPLWGRGIIILLDEIDGISAREDAGGLSELLQIIPKTVNPIVMTANDPWKEQLRPLREVCLLVEFKPLTVNQIVSVLQRICDLEGLYCEREALRYIAEKAEGDLRAAINDLEAVAEGYGKVTMSIVRAIVRGREKSIDIWRTLNGVFYARYAWQAKKAVTSSEEDYETLIAWINDNIPRKYSDVEDYMRAYDALARATVFLSRAKYGGDWSLLAYVFDLMGPGVAFARRHPHAKMRYSYPDRIKLLARMKEVREVRERLAEKLASRVLTSKSTVKNEILPLLFVVFREGPPDYAARLALGYRMDEKEIQFLAGARYRDIVKAAERIKRARAAGYEEKATETRRAEAGVGAGAFGPLQPATRSTSTSKRRRRRTGGRRGQRTLF